MDCGAIMTGGVGPTFFCFLSCLVTPKTSSSKVKALGNYCNEAWDQNENLTMWAFPSVILSPQFLIFTQYLQWLQSKAAEQESHLHLHRFRQHIWEDNLKMGRI